MKKRFSILLVIVWLGVIFWFSQQPGDESSSLSQFFLFSFLIEGRTQEQIQLISLLIRKAAHVTEYFILSGLVYYMFSCHRYKGLRRAGYAFLFVLFSAAFDEFHQSFIPGRGPSVKDVMIDMIGFVMSSAVMIKIRSKRHQ